MGTSLEKKLEPWERIAWSEEHMQIIYREWGVFATHKQQLDIAIHYYTKSLEIKDNDIKALHYLSLCKKYKALSEASYNDAIKASGVDSYLQPVEVQVCDAMYDMNLFEHCGVELHSRSRKFKGLKVKAFKNRINVVEDNLMDSLGESLHPFILENSKYFNLIKQQREKQENPDLRPLWKILREQEMCDILSVLEELEELVHPREQARRQRGYKIFNQIYLNKSWKDVLFLKGLKSNKSLLLPQAVSTGQLKEIAESKYYIVIKFLRMLQARNPLYNEKQRRCPDKKICHKSQEDYLYRIQYQTRRAMFIILGKIKELRKSGNIFELSRYIEEVMGNYIIVKTHRLMPWKFEFINEVYNTLSLAYLDQLVIPPYLDDYHNEIKQLFCLLGLPSQEESNVIQHFVFGDRSTWTEPEAIDYGYIRYKKLINRLEKRLVFAKYSIEKCYILYEIAKNHLMQNKFDECCSVAKRVVEESDRDCQNKMWKFLGQYIICRANILQLKIEKAQESFLLVVNILKELKSPRISEFIMLAIKLNDKEITNKRMKRMSAVTHKARQESVMSMYFSEMSI